MPKMDFHHIAIVGDGDVVPSIILANWSPSDRSTGEIGFPDAVEERGRGVALGPGMNLHYIAVIVQAPVSYWTLGPHAIVGRPGCPGPGVQTLTERRSRNP